MKKANKYRLLSGVLAGITLIPVSETFASDSSSFAYQCEEVSSHLSRLIDENRNQQCSGDLKVAQAYLDAATMSLKYDKALQALKMLKKGQHELEDLSNRSWCRNFAPLVKVDIAAIIRLRAEINLGYDQGR